MSDTKKTIQISTGLILLIMATDFYNLDDVDQDIKSAVDQLTNLDIDLLAFPALGVLVQTHLLVHIYWLAYELNQACDVFGNTTIEELEWWIAICATHGDYQEVPLIHHRQIVDLMSRSILPIARLNWCEVKINQLQLIA